MKKEFDITGMSCNSCAQHIEDALKEKVNSVSVSFSNETAEIDFNPEKISETEIKDIIKEIGYEVKDGYEVRGDTKTGEHLKTGEPEFKPEHKSIHKKGTTETPVDKLGWFVLIGSIALLIFVIYHFFLSGLNLETPTAGDKAGIFLLFFVGILTGFHCIAMCGGFVVSYTAKNAIKGHKSYKQHLAYGGSKLLSYALIGGIFGLIGGVIAFSIGLRGWIAVLAGTFMIFYALSMFGFKFFRKFQFNPKFLTKAAHTGSRHATGPYKAPIITGLLSGLFIACGPLQAMYLYAMGTGNFTTGFASLAAFGLGTLPVMIGFGSMTTAISKKTTKRILKFSAILVLVLGLIMLNRGLTVLGSPVTYDSLKETVIKSPTGNVILKGGYQEINMEVNRNGWSPNSFVLKKDIPVRWNIDVKELTSCNNEIIVKDYNLDIKLKKGLQTVEFTPTKKGTIRWSCWMGMIPGSFIVTDSGQATQQEVATATPSSSGGCSGGAGGGSCGSSSCGASSGGGCGCG